MAATKRKETIPYGAWVDYRPAPHVRGWRARFKVGNTTAKAQVLPDMDGSRWLWGVAFPEREELKDAAGTITQTSTRGPRKVGGHEATAKEAMDAAEHAAGQEVRHARGQ